MVKSDKCSWCQLALSSYRGKENRSTASHLPAINWSIGNPYYSFCLAGCGYGLDTGGYWLHSPSITATHLPLALLHQSALSAKFVSSLFVLALPSFLLCFSVSFLCFTCSLHLLKHISDFRTWFLLRQKLCFISPCSLAFTPLFNAFLFRSPSSAFHLSITASTGPIHSKWFYKAQYLLPKRQWPTHKWPIHSCLISCYSNKEREEHQMAPTKFCEYLEHIKAWTHKGMNTQWKKFLFAITSQGFLFLSPVQESKSHSSEVLPCHKSCLEECWYTVYAVTR